MDVYETMTGAEIRDYGAADLRTRQANVAAQGNGENPRDAKLRRIEQILSDTQNKPRNPYDKYYMECGLFYR